MELIIEIYNILVDLYQQFFGIPEGITYALFGSRKRKKAQKKIDAVQKDIDKSLAQTGGLDSEPPNDTNADVDTSEFVDDEGEKLPKDIVPHIPRFPYNGKQIILNSGRLHLNANEDFIIINSKKSISLGAPGSVNIDTNGGFVVNAQSIKLGIGEGAKHPIVKGDVLKDILFQITINLAKMKEQMDLSVDSTGAPIEGSKQAGIPIRTMIKNIDELSTRLLSDKNFTQ